MRNDFCVRQEHNAFYGEVLKNIFSGEISLTTCLNFSLYFCYLFCDVNEIYVQSQKILEDELICHKNLAKLLENCGEKPIFFDKNYDFLPKNLPTKNMLEYAICLKEKCIVNIKIAKTKIKHKKILFCLDEIIKTYQNHKNIYSTLLGL
ncbi:MAG: hypothetical protein IJA69_02750 [Clostridia bacterium]|nr:hypothetical protein [Clostridia bacterium]